MPRANRDRPLLPDGFVPTLYEKSRLEPLGITSLATSLVGWRITRIASTGRHHPDGMKL